MSEWLPWVSPATGAPLEQVGDSLTSPEGESFDIVDGIPRFVPADNYAAAFGAQWKRYRRTQLDSHTGAPITRTRLRRCCGEEVWKSLSGSHVLECGCGAGRFTEVLLDEGAVVTSVDLSSAVEANQENFPQDGQHRLAQADILRLPFAPGGYDVVICLGVIQHTPNPEHTIVQLARQVKPGGWLIIDHYTGSLSHYTKIGAIMLRPILKRLPTRTRFAAVSALVRVLFPLHRVVRRFTPAQALLSRLSPLYTYYRTYPELNHSLQREWSLLDTHDALTDWFKHFRSTEQIRDVLTSEGFESVWCVYGGNGVEARGQKPTAP